MPAPARVPQGGFVKRPLVLSLAVVAACALLAAAALLWLRPGKTPALPASGVLRIGYAVEAPHAFLASGGEVSGQSPELAKLVAQRLGAREVQWRLTEFGELIPELEAGRIDVIAAGMFITPERARRVAFSEPIFHVSQALLVARGNPRGLHAYRDAAGRPGVRIAALSGSVEAELLRRLGLGEAQILLVPGADTGRDAVAGGLADGLALSSPTLEWMAMSDRLKQTEIARPFTQPDAALLGRYGYGAFAFRKGDRALLAAWNAAQKEILRGPEYARIMERFGFAPQEHPGEASAEEVARP